MIEKHELLKQVHDKILNMLRNEAFAYHSAYELNKINDIDKAVHLGYRKAMFAVLNKLEDMYKISVKFAEIRYVESQKELDNFKRIDNEYNK